MRKIFKKLFYILIILLSLLFSCKASNEAKVVIIEDDTETPSKTTSKNITTTVAPTQIIEISTESAFPNPKYGIQPTSTTPITKTPNKISETNIIKTTAPKKKIATIDRCKVSFSEKDVSYTIIVEGKLIGFNNVWVFSEVDSIYYSQRPIIFENWEIEFTHTHSPNGTTKKHLSGEKIKFYLVEGDNLLTKGKSITEADVSRYKPISDVYTHTF